MQESGKSVMEATDLVPTTLRGSGPGTLVLVSGSVPLRCGFSYVPMAVCVTLASGSR